MSKTYNVLVLRQTNENHTITGLKAIDAYSTTTNESLIELYTRALDEAHVKYDQFPSEISVYIAPGLREIEAHEFDSYSTIKDALDLEFRDFCLLYDSVVSAACAAIPKRHTAGGYDEEKSAEFMRLNRICESLKSIGLMNWPDGFKLWTGDAS